MTGVVVSARSGLLWHSRKCVYETSVGLVVSEPVDGFVSVQIGNDGLARVATSNVVPLPLPGEVIRFSGRRAVWVGLSGSVDADGRATVMVVDDEGEFSCVRLPVTGVDARSVVVPDAEPLPTYLLVAALADAGRHLEASAARVVELERRHEDMATEALELADEHNWCDVYDRFAERWDWPGRMRDYVVRVRVFGYVDLSYEARDTEDAEGCVDSSAVYEELDGNIDHLDWEISEVFEK